MRQLSYAKKLKLRREAQSKKQAREEERQVTINLATIGRSKPAQVDEDPEFQEAWDESAVERNMKMIEEYKYDSYNEKLKLGLHSLTKGCDYRAIKFLGVKENLINVGTMKVRRDTMNTMQ